MDFFDWRIAMAGWALAGAAWAQAPVPARGWDSYQTIMWSTGTPRDFSQWIERLREIGFTAEECGAGRDAEGFLRNTFGFYVENLAPELGFLNTRKPIYDADFQGYTTTRDKKYLVRKPCLNDPEFWETAQARLQALVRPYVSQQPLLYQLRDELSIGSFASPMDYCFGPHTLREFRHWLQEVYGWLEALNQEWETEYASWEEVVPMTTYEIKDRERAALASGKLENYAPWADHRAFMDLTFARALVRFRGFIRELDQQTPVGIEGTQMPSAWGGFDLWRLSQAVDWAEPYDIAGSREIWRSFLPQGTPVLSTVFGSDFPHIRQKLWWLLLHGDRGAIVWDDENSRSVEKDQEGLPITERGRGLGEVFAELEAAAPQIFGLRRVAPPIAIHYSQASIRAHWMFDSREDKDTWPRRFSSYEATHSRFARVRDSFMRAVEDLGLQYNFVSYEQIENGELAESGYKVLILPQSVAMSERECRRIEAFVRAGGTLIADNMTATMDEHCRRLPRGQLDELLGIERKGVGWRAKPGGGTLATEGSGVAPLEGFEPDIAVVSGEAQRTSTGVPVLIENQVGDGRAVYLNLGMHDYGKYRLTPPLGDGYRELFARILKESGIEPAIRVLNADDDFPVPCVEVWRYVGEEGEYVALMRNPEFDTSSLRQVGYPDNTEIEKSVRIRVIFNRGFGLTDVRTGETLGAADRIETELEPWSPVILKLETWP
jgi:hypothetical protein